MDWVKRNFTVARWGTNPWQLWSITALFIVSILQLVIGFGVQSVQYEANDPTTRVMIALTTFFGSLICLYGLHLRSLESALWIEVTGYINLLFVLAVYVYQVIDLNIISAAVVSWPTNSGFALTVSAIPASVHRTIQIIQYKRAVRRKNQILALADRLGVTGGEK